jgi:hypothetical protein
MSRSNPLSRAKRVNEIMRSLYAERGMPDRVSFSEIDQAIIAEFADGVPFVHPLQL